VSLLIFGVTYREISARRFLHQKTIDLIDSQKANEKLLAAEQASRIAAEQANLAKDEFLAVVSHELRTPLNAIAGWNRILKTPGVSEDTRRTAVEKIDKNLRLQTGIVEELLNFSDIMSSSLVFDRAPLQVRGLFQEAVASAGDAARQKGVVLVESDTLDGECVLGDRHNLKLAITHILNNAVKFTPTGGSIEAKAYAESGALKFVIKDTGIGIEPDAMTHIFDEYRQSERASTRHYGGLGLGLTIAEHIIKLHHGTIEVFSAGIGQGSTFTITIPAQS
jgi:signal transduction histidine kinase